MIDLERIQKLIAKSGIASRRKAEELIKEGKVRLNGIVVTELGTKASYEDSIIVDGKRLSYPKPEYYLLNKPRNIISSTKDDKQRKTVVDLIDTKSRIYPIGRLDYDTTGLIILTNDGELSNILMHPSNEVPKTYLVKIKGIMQMDTYHKLKKGLSFDEIRIKPKRLKIKATDTKKDNSLIEITIVEGQNHIIKRIFEYLGFDVLKLTRVGYGFLKLEKMLSGEYRHLSDDEVKKLYSYKKELK